MLDSKLKVLKVSSCYLRFVWLEIDGKEYCLRINDNVYCALKSIGVPTSQSLRKCDASKM